MKPTVTNARYRVVERSSGLGYFIYEGKIWIGMVEIPSVEGGLWGYGVPYRWWSSRPTAQVALDALVAAYGGNGEAGE